MRWVYISPHFDDAVLSCGGLIWEQSRSGMQVEIWTICAGDAPPGPLSMLAQVCHFQWGTKTAEETVARRRLEDQEAVQQVGADAVHFSIPDCIYRRSPAGEWLYPDDLFVPLHPSEKVLASDIAVAVNSELSPDDTLICPLAIGAHPDHVIVRSAAEQLGRPLLYYADIPYLFDHPEALAPATERMEATFHPIPEDGIIHWQNGIAAYASQIPVLFHSEDRMQAIIHTFWEGQQGVQLWQASKG